MQGANFALHRAARQTRLAVDASTFASIVEDYDISSREGLTSNLATSVTRTLLLIRRRHRDMTSTMSSVYLALSNARIADNASLISG